MKTLKSIFALTLAATFMISGCAREPYEPPVLPTNTKGTCEPSPTDPDGDCITNPYEVQNNEKTKEIECKLEDDLILYLDCTEAPDCNCDFIPDGEQIEMVEDCGWGCVAGNARTYAMIAGGLVLGYAGYAPIAGAWPFGKDKAPENDINNNDIEYISLVNADDRIDFDNSYVRFIEDKSVVQVYIEGKCQSDDDPSQFICKVAYQYGIDEINLPTNNSTSTDPYRDNMRYSYDLMQSPLHEKNLHYIKVYDGRNEKEYYLKDPKWIGLPVRYSDEPIRMGFELKGLEHVEGSDYMFSELELGLDESKSCYIPHHLYSSSNSDLLSDTNAIYYYWERRSCP